MTFESLLIRFSSASLCGIKSASLLSVDEQWFNKYQSKIKELNSELFVYDRFIVPILRNKDRILLFVYDKNLLQQNLKKPEIKNYLVQKGYPKNATFDLCLSIFFAKLQNELDFPHEIGVFLGYPLEDVIGFEKNLGLNCKYCNVWKVYGDVKSAQKTCAMYAECKILCQKWLTQGNSIIDLIENYSALTAA